MINPSCTILGPGAAREGVVPRCPTKVREDGEASENPEDWGECHSDCPLRAYRDNQVIRINIKKTQDNFAKKDLHHIALSITFFSSTTIMHNDEAQELLADLRRLSEESPSLATTYTIGNSVLGQTLQVVFGNVWTYCQ